MSRRLETLLASCKTRDQVIPIYRKALLTHSPRWSGWRELNAEIIEQWSVAGLTYIKERAWRV